MEPTPATGDPRLVGLVGRDDDLQRLRSFLDEASSSGGALLLAGAPGIGKTVLLDQVVRAAASAGTRVIRAAGSEFLTDLSFSTLSALLQPLHPLITELDQAQREAVTAMLGLEDGAVTDALLGSNAVLSLLKLAAADQPLLVVVDDAHWADRATASLLGFVARRLAYTRVGLLAAFRPGVEGFFVRAGLPQHELNALADGDAATLLATRYPLLNTRTARRILEEAEGNPLALLELPLALSAATQRDPVPAVGGVLPLSRRLHALYATRVAALPAATQHLLLVAALEGTGDVTTVLTAAKGRAALADLGPAERAQLVRVEAGVTRLTFSHPLVRSTVVDVAAIADRIAAQRCLAEALAHDPVRHARHLAEAAVDPDERVAGLLENAARLVLQRGDAVGAFTCLLRAADLSLEAEARSRRLAAAAYVGADVTGELQMAAQLLVEARRADPAVRGSLRAAVAAAHLLLNAEGEITTAHRLLVGALQSPALPTEEPGARQEALLLLLEVCLYSGRPTLWRSFLEVQARFPDVLPPVVSVVARILGDPAGVGQADVRLVEDAIETLLTQSDPTVIEHVCTAAHFLDRSAQCRAPLWRLVEDGRRGGAVVPGVGALAMLAADAFNTGQWDLCQTMSEEGLSTCAENGFEIMRWPFLYSRAVLGAARGEQELAEALMREMDEWALPRRINAVTGYARQTGALFELGRGDPAAAYAHAVAVTRPGELPPGVPQALFVTMDLVEAALGSGHRDAALAHVDVMQSAGLAEHAPRLALLTAAVAAMTAEEPAASALFERALALPGADRWPFHAARTRLLHGEHLHRLQEDAAARDQLTSALVVFRRLGADPWVARTTHALRAAGGLGAGTGPFALADLTAAEREIAALAAAGLTNKQIGAQLFMSHRTVGAHLYRIFPKLGVTSRAALRDALMAAPPP